MKEIPMTNRQDNGLAPAAPEQGGAGMALMKSDIRGLFVTGSDTGVGKTRVGAALARLLVEQGVSVRPRKPVESGCPREAGRLCCQDAWALKSAARSLDPIETVCPYPMEAAVAPDRAARLAGLSLTIDELAETCRAGLGKGDFLLV
jgi:dethiobiotin synthetase